MKQYIISEEDMNNNTCNEPAEAETILVCRNLCAASLSLNPCIYVYMHCEATYVGASYYLNHAPFK